ncbi:P-selectin [Macrobrachium rosenbergii]|uniref:P-selectin n=1 Tax=Macrobrachium rosenbergii TaxID=79674 RepID=UPI0034D58B74
MKYRKIRGLLVFFSAFVGISQGVTCPHPAVPINTQVSVSSREPGSTATYSCDPGYTIFGSATATCGADGKWAGELPHCATNVAWKKPVNQSSTARGGTGENANDGDLTTVHDGQKCTETLVEASPWWVVDLLQEYEITVVRITTRGCCGHQPVQDIEIRVGDSINIQRNRLCAWFPGTIEEGATKELSCARAMKGRYVFVQMVGVEGSMSLCEVEVFSTQEFSKERCSSKVELSKLGIFNQTCYELQITEGGTFERGREHCQGEGGDLVHGVGKITHSFLASELDRVKDKMKTNLFWIGAQKEPSFISRTWKWIDGEVIESPTWGRDQPNNYNGKQNCAVFDGGREWKWNDVGCELNYLHWICQFQPASCGSPDRNENTTVGTADTGRGSTVTYQCPVGNKIVGDATRTCLDTGFWSGSAPTCKYVECGQPKEIEHGSLVLVDGRTNHGAKAVYECTTNYTIVGESTSVCSDDGNWSPEAPECLYSWCPEIEAPIHGEVQLSGRRAGDTATFTCEPGYYMMGTKTISCALGGQWSGKAPSCRFIDCGIPEDIRDGKMTLVNGTTFLNSMAIYECGDDFWLDGPEERACLEDGRWSDVSPECVLIACNEPVVPHGGFVTGYSFNVHAEIEYHCENGHYLTGDNVRVCTRDGEWTGEIPTCTYVDCGRVPTLSRGEVIYVNESTYLDSQLRYACSANYRIVGDHVRNCMRDGLWSGTTPKCEEIRCSEPEHPPLTKNTVTGNDRRMSSTVARSRGQNAPVEHSYRVGSVITYRCERGYVVEGKAMRQCQPNGSWNNEPPSCKYVDCGLPESISPGTYRLLSNETSFGAQVAYECVDNWKIEGRIRRFCQENGTWAGETPKCIEVLCPGLTDNLAEPLKVDEGNKKVGSFATYSCEEGRKLIGESKRECRTNGIWSGSQPRCEWVSCMMPAEIENGRIVRLNETLLYGAVVEYHCLPKFRLDGPFTRTCTGEGVWSGENPRCTLDDESDFGILVDNTVDGTTNSAHGNPQGTFEEASNTGLYVGLAFGLIGVICVALLFLFLRTRQQKGKVQDPPTHMKPREEHHNSSAMSYADLSDPTTGNNIYENIPDDVEEYTDMSSGNYSTASVRHTYANGHQPTYTNGMMESAARPPAHIMRRPRMPPPQPPTVPVGGVPSSVVTINGVSVAANAR